MVDFAEKTVVITGGASGIGAALAKRFSAAGAKVFVLDKQHGDETAPGTFIPCDVTVEPQLTSAIASIQETEGAIDIFVSNAGVLSDQPGGAASATNSEWTRCFEVNFMAHVYAARALLPAMVQRGSGYFVTIASAAGLLNQIGDAAYSASKHAAVSFAESLAITHASDGIHVTLVCPQYVATPMLGLKDEAADGSALLTADEVAQCVLKAVQNGRFLVLPHPEVREFAQLRAQDHDRWIKGMVNLRSRAVQSGHGAGAAEFYKLV